jgi:hypothetical protein
MMQRGLALLLALACIGAKSVATPTDDDARKVAIAMLAPEEQRLEIQSVLGYCSKELPDIGKAANATLLQWIDRQATLLYVAALYRSSARARSLDASQPEATRAALVRLLDVDIPRVIKNGVAQVLQPFEDAKRDHTLKQRCASYLKDVGEGRLDLKNEDPDLVRLMEKSAPATTLAAEGPP